MLRARSAPAIALGWSSLLIVLGLHVASCASSGAAPPPTPCDRNSDCDHAYCANGYCKVDCVDPAVDCKQPGAVCNLIGQCDPADGAGGNAGTSGAGGSAGNASVGGNAGAGVAGTSSKGGTASAGASSAGTSSTGGTQSTGGTSSAGASAGTGNAGTSSTGGTPSTGGTSAQGGAGGTGNTGGTSSAGTGGTGAPFGAGGGPGTGAELDACTADGDCVAPLLCRADYKNGPLHCTRTCNAKADCSERRCETVDGAKVCIPGDVGRACTAADQCDFGCLTTQGYCTSTCATGSDCPSGYGCAAVGSPAVSVCVKLEAACDASDSTQCIAGAASCDMTMLVSGCTMACNSASDCPVRAAGFAPWTCDAGGICRRPSDVAGPLPGGSTPTQYACNAANVVVNLCNDAQHIDFTQFTIPNPPAVSCTATMTTDGVPGDACVDTCRYQGGCAFGFACTAVGGAGSARIGLCLPHGASPVGTACTTDAQCLYGYCASNKCSRDCTADGLCPTGSQCVAAGGPAVEGQPFKRCQ